VAAENVGHVRAVASGLGSTPLAELQRAYPGVAVFRLLPNTPVAVRQGVVCHVPLPGRGEDALEREVLARSRRLGTVVEVEERLMMAAMGMMSVGPAYQALLAEAQVDGAVRHGIGPGVASRMVVQTSAPDRVCEVTG
jgi:pyrroline-5-carboxylate reductase